MVWVPRQRASAVPASSGQHLGQGSAVDLVWIAVGHADGRGQAAKVVLA